MMTQELLAELESLPQEWRLCCVNGDKKPFHPDQQFLANGKPDPRTPSWKDPLPRDRIRSEIERGRAKAVGILLGGDFLAVDADGSQSIKLAEVLSGQPATECLNHSVTWTSGLEGRQQTLYAVPKPYQNLIKTHKLKIGSDQLEWRYDGCQSVLAGVHPRTGRYRYVLSPQQTDVALMPWWLIREDLRAKVRWQSLSNSDKALAGLAFLYPARADDYENWYQTGAVLHYVASTSGDPEAETRLLSAWDFWSKQCPEKYDSTLCQKKWDSFRADRDSALTLGSLLKWASDDDESRQKVSQIESHSIKLGEVPWKGKPPSSHSQSGEDDFGSLKAETDNLLSQSSQDFNLEQLFPDKLAIRLNAIAQVFNQPAIAVAAPLLSIAGSLLRVGTLIRIQVRSDFAQPPIIWVAEVGDSDSGKSPIISILKKALSSLQLDAYQGYLKRKVQHEWDLAEWEGTPKKNRGPKPKLTPMRQFLFDDFTTEAIAESLQHHPEHGALVCVDELAAVLYGFNQYKKRGNDRQRWLTLYDGAELNISRKTQELIYLSRTNLPVVGGIQPIVLREVIGDLEHVDGFWPRFYYVRMPLTVMPSVDWHNDTDIGLNEILSKAYLALNNLPAKTYCLSAECQRMWDDWHWWTEQERFNEPHPALRAIYRKARARAARVALVIHCLNAVVDDRTPADDISSNTLSAAIAFTNYGIYQIRSIYADFGVVDNPEASRIARFVERFQGIGWIDWLKVRRWWNGNEKPNKEASLKFMTQLVKLGYARYHGQLGKNYQIQIINCGQNGQNTSHPSPSNDLKTVKPTDKLTIPTVKNSDIKVETPDLGFFDQTDGQNDQISDHAQGLISKELEDDFDRLTVNNKNKTTEKVNVDEIDADSWLDDKSGFESPKTKPSDCWKTPNTPEQPILTLVSQVLNGVGLDPTADDARVVPAKHHFTQADNCLDKSWKALGAVFMNPPFSRSLPFVKKLVQEYQTGHTPEAIALLLAGTLHNKGTGSVIWSSAKAICHWGCGKARRIAFLDEERNTVHGADFDCILVYWGNKRKQFKESFQHYGNVSFNDPESSDNGHSVTNNLQPSNQEDLSLVKEVVNSGQRLVKLGHELVTNPRQACVLSSDKIEVDETKLDLNCQPEIPIPTWQPNRELKPYEELSKLYLDIETTGLDPEQDCVLLVGFRDEQGQVTILDDRDEAVLLQQTWQFIRDKHPEVLIGHNLFNFDLPFLIKRWQHHSIKHHFKVGDKASTISASSFHGKPIQFTSIRLAGTQILDTFQQICVWDKSAARLTSYGLKPSVRALGLRVDERLELTAQQIQAYAQAGNHEPVKTYLEADLEDTQLLADFLLPVVYYQRKVVPGLSLQDLAVASPALKAQKLHELLITGSRRPQTDTSLKYEGGLIHCHQPGLHPQVAKIDISSLYPSIMLRYGICSQKDPEHCFLGVMQYMREERLRLKALAKSGHQQADHEQNALKILINGSYGFLGTKGYSFNDYSAASLVTAYGRKILRLMEDTIEACGAALIESDTDGTIFSHSQPEHVYQAVCQALPDGVTAELEFSDCGIYIPKAKSYVIVYPDGKTSIKGLFRKRDRYPLENQFPVQFLRHYFLESPDVAQAYYEQSRAAIANRQISIEQLTTTRKIGAAEKQLVQRGLGQPGEIVSYYYIEQKRCHARSGKSIKNVAAESTSGDYWIDWYLTRLDQQYQEITGKAPKLVSTEQLVLLIGRAS